MVPVDNQSLPLLLCLIDQDVIVGQYLWEWAVRQPSLFLATNLAQFRILLDRWRGHRAGDCCHRHLLGAQHQEMCLK